MVSVPAPKAESPTTPFPSPTVTTSPRGKKGRQTLFERYGNRADCESNPAICDGDFLQIDIKKTIQMEIDPSTNLSTEFCLGGCSPNSAVQWSLEWQ